MKKNLLILLIALASLPHLSAAVGDSFTYDGLNYTVLSEDDLTVEVARYSSPSGDLSIPSIVTYNGSDYTVTSIGYGAFYNCSSLTSVFIPNSVTSIDDEACSWCSSLTSVTIPNSVTFIGDSAFSECSSLTSVSIPNSVTSIGNSVFYWCRKLTSVTIPNSVSSIGNSAFWGCSSLTSVDIPNSVTSIGYGAFSVCSSLTSVTIPNSMTSIGDVAFWGCSSLTSVDIPNSVTSIGNSAFSECSSLTSVDIPNSVTSIGERAFEGCSSLTSIIIPNSVTSIGEWAFYSCSNLTSVTIPNSVTSIGDSAFFNCSSLTSVTIPNSVTSIGSSTFYGCSSLTSATIPNSVTSIGESAFRYCSSLTSVAIPNSVTSIGEWAFYWCSSLTSATIPNSVTSIGESAFQYCSSLTSVTIPNSVTSIGDVAFAGCSKLTSVTIPNSVTSIGNSAFSECSSLTSVTIPNSVTSIGDYAFQYCSSLTSVTIPNSVTSIGFSAFYGCTNITKIINLNPTPQSITYSTFYNVPTEAVVYIPKGSLSSYSVSREWSQFKNFRERGVLNITLSATSIELKDGGSVEITAIVEKEDDITIEGDEWSSSNTDVATVDGGKVTAIALGTAVISYTVTDGYGIECTESCTVTVNPILAESIALDRTELVLTIGATDKLTATVLPEDVTDKTVTWTSSDNTIVTVDPEGNIQALALGEAVITAACGEKSATCKVTVNPILAESIALDRTELVLTIGATDKLTATVLPEDVTDKTVTWTSSDDTIVKVDEEGNIQALALGEATITAACGEKSATCKVTVNPILAESIALDRTELVLTIGATDKLTATVLPEDVTDKTVTWTSSDDTIVKVDEDGNIQALALGEAVITASCGEKSATCKVTVNPILAESIALDRTELVLTIGATDKLTATVLPEDVTDKTVTWTSSDDTIVKVDAEGNIQALALGEAIITAACGEKSATCKVTVNPILAESIALDRTELVLTIGATDKLTATVLPEDVTDKTVTWTSSDDTIVKVDEEGNIQALALGEATITAACGEKSATCKVTVNPILAESIALDRTELVLTIGATDKLTATVLPEDVTDKTVTWTSSDDTIVKVDEDGNIQALALGEAVITASCGEQSATCKVTVNPILAESIALDRTELVLTIGATDKLTATVLPEDVTDKTVTWASSDESIATVDEDGNVTAIAEGEAVITATCGEVSASCNVTVKGIVTGIVYVENDDINITVNGTELTVETSRPSAKVTIVRQDGAVIYTGENRGLYYLVRGLYIVVVDNATQKIVIN